MDRTPTERYQGHLLRLGALALVLGIVPAVMGGLDFAVTPEYAIATHVTMLMTGVLYMSLALAWRDFELGDGAQLLVLWCLGVGGFLVVWTGTLAGVLGVGGETLSAFAADGTGTGSGENWVKRLLRLAGLLLLVGLGVIATGNTKRLALLRPRWQKPEDVLSPMGFVLIFLGVLSAWLSAFGWGFLGVVANATLGVTGLILMALGHTWPDCIAALERKVQDSTTIDAHGQQVKDLADELAKSEVAHVKKWVPLLLGFGAFLNVVAGVVARISGLDDRDPLSVVSAGWTRAFVDWDDGASIVKLVAAVALGLNSYAIIAVAHSVFRALPETGYEATMEQRLGNRLLRFGTLALAVGFLTAWLPELSRVPRVGVGTYATLLIIGPMFICFAMVWWQRPVLLSHRRQRFVVSSLSLGALGVIVAGMVLALLGIGGRTLNISAAGAIGSDRAELFAKVFVDAAIGLVGLGMILFWIAVRPKSRTLINRIVWAGCMVLVAVAVQAAFYFAYLKVRSGSGYPIRLPDYGYVADSTRSNDDRILVTREIRSAENQNWAPDDWQWFYHTSQGGAFEVPIPYDWIMALEQPTVSVKPRNVSLLMTPDYLRRFGFLPNEETSYHPQGLSINQGYISRFLDNRDSRSDSSEVVNNPDELPVGFARAEGWIDQSTGRMIDAMGFTCAACHTSQIDYLDPRGDTLTSLRIEGGPANVDLGKFRRAVSMSLGLTRLQPWRFERFADRLGVPRSGGDRRRLREELDSLVTRIARVRSLQDSLEIYPTEEGFGRLDAFGRIFNFVFGSDLGIDDNLDVANAPVNFPYLWDAPRFQWVQYNASFQQPMIRNLGQSMGVFASLDLHGAGRPVQVAKDPMLFASSVEVLNVHEMELLIGGCVLESDNRPGGLEPGCGDEPDERFLGLQSPRWPNVFPPINSVAVDSGRVLYSKNCASCHLPGDPDSLASDPTAWTTQGRNSFLRLEVRSLDEIGTDPLAATNFATRQVQLGDLAGRLGRPYRMRAADALPLLIDSVLARRYRDFGVDTLLERILDGHREPGTQVFLGYRARPLNGVWATPPFLHNGSVPTLWHLLSPQSERPDTFYLGSRIFDPYCVGFDHSGKRMSERAPVRFDCPMPDSIKPDFVEPDSANADSVRAHTRGLDRGPADPGYFRFDTSLPGNSNLGHSFEGSEANYRGRHGVLGPGFTQRQRMQIIEYLKTLEPLPVRPVR